MKMKIDWKNRKSQLLIVLLTGVLLVVIAMPVKKGDEKEEIQNTESVGHVSNQAYGEALEKRLEEVLKQVEGVGQVEVMITFQTSAEKIIEKDEEKNSQSVEEEDSQGGSRITKEVSGKSSTVYDSTSGGTQTPYVAKEINPKAEGVIVIAEGGDRPVVVKNITEAVRALFDVDTHKIKVMKRNQTN